MSEFFILSRNLQLHDKRSLSLSSLQVETAGVFLHDYNLRLTDFFFGA